MNKRELMVSLLDEGAPPYVPAAFFLHFGPDYREGQAAVDRHLAYFRHTGMDVVKIQYEHTFPVIPGIQRPEDWDRMPSYGEDFYAAPLRVVEDLVKAAKDEALVLMTLYSPFMCAGHTTSDATITEHLKQDPERVRPGLAAITESLLTFVRACVRLGVDGFYASTQGGEAHRFASGAIFESFIEPYDRVVLEEIDRTCAFNILHVCDYHGGYDDLSPFRDYPGDVVNCSLHVGDRVLTPREAGAFFDRPFMGGMDRHGAIASGDRDAIVRRVESVVASAPERFILGADCTVPGDTDWDDLRLAIATAHATRTR
jgi:uroporphyrinogen decarboxylase